MVCEIDKRIRSDPNKTLRRANCQKRKGQLNRQMVGCVLRTYTTNLWEVGKLAGNEMLPADWGQDESSLDKSQRLLSLRLSLLTKYNITK